MKRAITSAIVAIVLIVGGILISHALHGGGSDDPNQYRFIEAKRDTVRKTVTATGVLSAWTTVDIKSKAGGQILKLPVDDGTIVRKGDLLCTIDPADTLLTYDSARADIAANRADVAAAKNTLDLQKQESVITVDTARAGLKAAEAATRSARSRLDTAKSQAAAQPDLTESSIDNAKETLAGEKSRLEQMKTALHPQSNAAALAGLHQSEANVANADANLKRAKALLAKGFYSQVQVDAAQQTYDVAKADLLTTKEKVDTIKAELDNDLLAEEARVRQLAAALKTAEASRVDIAVRRQAAEAATADYLQAVANQKQAEVKLREAIANRLNDQIRAAQLASAKAAGGRAAASYINAKVTLDQTRVTAPSDGIILKKYVEQGTIITSGISFSSLGTSIVQMGDISRMYVDVQVDETDIASIELDQKVDVSFDAYSTISFEGKVIKIDPQAVVDQNVTTVHVRVEIDNSAVAYRLLKPGMNATCEFIVKKKDDILAVPNEAVHQTPEGQHYVDVAVGGKVAPADSGNDPDPGLLVGCKVVHRNVEIGLEGNDMTEIVSGDLKEGERAITQVIEPSPTNTGNPFGGGKGPGKR